MLGWHRSRVGTEHRFNPGEIRKFFFQEMGPDFLIKKLQVSNRQSSLTEDLDRDNPNGANRHYKGGLALFCRLFREVLPRSLDCDFFRITTRGRDL
jgi:hypothetical protein